MAACQERFYMYASSLCCITLAVGLLKKLHNSNRLILLEEAIGWFVC